MPVRLLDNKSQQDPNFSQVWDRMRPGEIYSAGGDTGMGPTYSSPGPDPMNPRDQINQQYGYQDYMQGKVDPVSEAERMSEIHSMTGAQMQIAPRQPVDQQKAQQYQSLSTADKMAIDLVNSGKMAPEQFYKIMKEDARKRDEAVLKATSELPFDRADMMQDGKPVPTSGGNIQDFMNPQGNTSAEFRDQTTRQVINSVSTKTGEDTSKRNAAGLKASTQLMAEYDKFADNAKDLDNPTLNTIANKGAIRTWVAMKIQSAAGGPEAKDNETARQEAQDAIAVYDWLEKWKDSLDSLSESMKKPGGMSPSVIEEIKKEVSPGGWNTINETINGGYKLSDLHFKLGKLMSE